MLGVFFNSTLDSVNKDFGLTQALTKESFEFFPFDENVNLILYFSLVLLPAKQVGIFKEAGGKWYPILTLGLSGSKMVLILQEEVIALQVSFILIHV